MLSKSKIMRGLQCPKSLWLYKNQKDLREISSSQEAIFQTGTNVGILAQAFFLGGVDATEGHKYPNKACAQKTLELIAEGQKVIYEATFIYQNVLVAIDILVFQGGAWHIYEVKSTTKVKDPHIQDAAVQKYIAEGNGLEIVTVSITVLNNGYVRKGALDIQQLFTSYEISMEILDLELDVEEIIEEMQAIEKLKNVPDIAIGSHCSNPYPCDFSKHCWKKIPNYSVFNLTRAGGKSWELFEQGILKLEDIPEDFPLSKSQRIQVDAEKKNISRFNKEEVIAFLNEIQYPIYFLDFETIMPSVPLFDNSKTYQQIVFQYSLHIQESEISNLQHLEYLAETNGEDPRLGFIQKIIKECGVMGSIIVYNQGFEAARLRELARDFPKYETELLALTNRLVDLMIPFQSKAIYTKEMQGSYSIKKVLPALVPELSYDDLEIGDGGTASSIFLNLLQGNFIGDVEGTKKALLEYCNRDTWAMVVLYRKLKEFVLKV